MQLNEHRYAAAENEVSLFWRTKRALLQAIAEEDGEEVRHSLNELEGYWLDYRPAIQGRCVSILDMHRPGWMEVLLAPSPDDAVDF